MAAIELYMLKTVENWLFSSANHGTSCTKSTADHVACICNIGNMYTHTHVYYIYILTSRILTNPHIKSHGFCSAPRTLLRGRIEGKIFGYHIQQLGTGHNEEKLQAPAERILCTAAPEWFLIILLLFILIFSNIHQNLDII
jgi:hypothetical protein